MQSIGDVIASQRVARNARPMTGSAKQSSFGAAMKDGLLRRFAPRNDGPKTHWLFEI
jgi:hypothetical protein